MATLITDAEFTEIRDLLNDVGDTFFQQSATYKIHASTLNRTGRDRHLSTAWTDKSVSVLIEWDDKGSGEMDVSHHGAVDFNAGTVYMKWDDAITQGLVDGSSVVLAQPERDRFVYNAVEYDILAANPVAQLKDTPVLLQFRIKRQLAVNADAG